VFCGADAAKETPMLAMQHDVSRATRQLATSPAAEAHRQAYNAAFDELGLAWHWDPLTYERLRAPGPDAVRTFLEHEHAHLLRAYDTDFLVSAIETTMRRFLRTNP
jgi:hypothetical protein